MSGEHSKTFIDHWGKIAKCSRPEQLDEVVKYFKLKKLKAGNKKNHHRLQFCIPGGEAEVALLATLRALGWEQKIGPAPRSSLEREAQRLLDKVSGK